MKREKRENIARFGVGIRGAGQVAYQHLAAIEANPHLYLAAVSSRSIESAEKLAAAAALSRSSAAGGVKVYAHYEDMLGDPRVDIVSECMPNHLHAPESILALDAGKHLILEKPAGITRRELEDLGAAVRRAAEKTPALKTVVSFVLRWHPLVKNLKSLLDGKAIGEVYYTEMDYWHGIKPSYSSYPWIRKKEFAGGAMITGGCHAADLARHLKGEVSEVSAYSCGIRDDFDYPTTYVAAVKFRDGTVGKLSASLDGLAFPYQFNIDLLGSAGAMRNKQLYSRDIFPAQNDWALLPCDTPDSGSVSHHPFKEEINDLVSHILGGPPVLSDLSDAILSMEIALAITESAESGRPVPIPAAVAGSGRA
jgi:predicted dehydrogenase